MPSNRDIQYLERRKATPSLISLHIIQLKQPNTPPLSDDKKAVIKAIRDYLKRAEAGNMHGLCITSANDDNTFDAECFGTYEKFPTDALGPLEVLKLKLTRRALGES